jgi:nucleotide-binding universal stress UspA family protein
MKKILVPVDLSHASTILLQYANTIAEKFGAKLIFLFVVEDLYSYSGLPVELRLDPFDEDYKSYSRRNMENFLEENRHHVTGEYESIVLSGHPAKEIVDYADREEIDLIVIGTHGFSGLDRMIFGSVAEKVIKRAPCPIMVVNTFREEE